MKPGGKNVWKNVWKFFKKPYKEKERTRARVKWAESGTLTFPSIATPLTSTTKTIIQHTNKQSANCHCIPPISSMLSDRFNTFLLLIERERENGKKFEPY